MTEPNGKHPGVGYLLLLSGATLKMGETRQNQSPTSRARPP